MPSSSDALGDITGDNEIENYIKSLTVSSDRVRHMVIISLIGSILLFAAYHNSLQDSWMLTRPTLARIVEKNHLYDRESGEILECAQRVGPTFPESCEEINRAFRWYQLSGHSKVSFQDALTSLESSRVADMQIVRVPFLGIQFDNNDLGIFSSIGMAMIALVLCYSMVRHHENVYLCLWKVRRIGEAEGRYSEGQSRANFLYHAMAMAQVFASPPTLARWRTPWVLRSIRFSARLALFFIPVFIQGLVLLHDRDTTEIGMLLNPKMTVITNRTHFGFFIILLLFTMITIVYATATDRRWKATFFEVNPAFRSARTPSWFTWVWPQFPDRYRFAERNGELFVVNIDRHTAWRIIPNQEDQEDDDPCPVVEVHSALENAFGGHRLKDGSFYERSKSEDGKILVTKKSSAEIAGRSEAARVEVAIVSAGGSITLYWVEGNQIMRVTSGDEKETKLTEIDLNGKLRSRRRIDDIVVLREHICFVDYAQRKVSRLVDGKEHLVYQPKQRGWWPVGVACQDDKIVVLSVPRGFSRFIPRKRPFDMHRQSLDDPAPR